MATGAGYMDLAMARQVARRPASYKVHRLWRALSILMRWAAEPCTDAEYWRRIAACRRVKNEAEYIEYMEARRSEKKYRPPKTEPTTFVYSGPRRGSSKTGAAAGSSGFLAKALSRSQAATALKPPSVSTAV